MLKAFVMVLKGSWVDYLPLIEFSCNNSYHNSSQMTAFKAFYDNKCRSPIGWHKVGETILFGPYLVYQVVEGVKIIRERLKIIQSQQWSMSM